MTHDIKFAGFIITYERPELIGDTISRVLSQTRPPSRLLIVDNSESDRTREAVDKIDDKRIVYWRIGHNAGPSGGARLGLEKLTHEGYQWIYWGDDDDPPKRNDCFEILLEGVGDLRKPGIVGAVGHSVNWLTMTISRTLDKALENSRWIEVDSIGGGMCLLVNAEVVKRGVLPDERIFYGFEELDFCIRVQQADFLIYAHSDLFKYYREHSKRNPMLAGKRGLKKDKSKLWREYYSARNILYILKKNGMFKNSMFTYLRLFGKIFYGFRYGMHYGFISASFIMSGVSDYVGNRMGKKSFK